MDEKGRVCHFEGKAFIGENELHAGDWISVQSGPIRHHTIYIGNGEFIGRTDPNGWFEGIETAYIQRESIAWLQDMDSKLEHRGTQE